MGPMPEDLYKFKEQLGNIKMLAMDVDGILNGFQDYPGL